MDNVFEKIQIERGETILKIHQKYEKKRKQEEEDLMKGEEKEGILEIESEKEDIWKQEYRWIQNLREKIQKEEWKDGHIQERIKREIRSQRKQRKQPLRESEIIEEGAMWHSGSACALQAHGPEFEPRHCPHFRGV